MIVQPSSGRLNSVR